MIKTKRFNATGEGQFGEIQQFIAPVSGEYNFELVGASGSGGNVFSTPLLAPVGGNGAKITAALTLKKGDVLDVVVGQMGTTVQATARDGTSGGGGGGTFIFRRIAAIADSRYQFTKNEQPFEVLFVAAGGGGSNDTSYAGQASNGFDGDADTIYNPTTRYIAPNTASGSPTQSASKQQGMGITQYINYDSGGGYYTRGNGKSLGGFGGGGSNDDALCAGGGWYGANSRAYSWSIVDTATGITGANNGHGFVDIKWTETLKWKTNWQPTEKYNYTDAARLMGNYAALQDVLNNEFGFALDFTLPIIDGYPMIPINTAFNQIENALHQLHIWDVPWLPPPPLWDVGEYGPEAADINRWEQNAQTIENTTQNIVAAFRHSGTFNSGMEGIRI